MTYTCNECVSDTKSEKCKESVFYPDNAKNCPSFSLLKDCTECKGLGYIVTGYSTGPIQLDKRATCPKCKGSGTQYGI